MNPDPHLEFVPKHDPETEQLHAELLDLLADGLAQHLVSEARAEAEAALGRPLRSAAALADEGVISSLSERPPVRRAARGA